MSALKWTRLPRHGARDWEEEYRRYGAGIGDSPDAVRLSRWKRDDGWHWLIEDRRSGLEVELPGGDWTDAEAKALAVAALAKAMRALLAELEGK